jgi:hypothetical protein
VVPEASGHEAESQQGRLLELVVTFLPAPPIEGVDREPGPAGRIYRMATFGKDPFGGW